MQHKTEKIIKKVCSATNKKTTAKQRKSAVNKIATKWI